MYISSEANSICSFENEHLLIDFHFSSFCVLAHTNAYTHVQSEDSQLFIRHKSENLNLYTFFFSLVCVCVLREFVESEVRREPRERKREKTAEEEITYRSTRDIQ